MDKIQKALQKLSGKERDVIELIFEKLKKNNTADFDLVKLKGYANIFRLRKGKFRILYSMSTKGDIEIIDVKRRDEKTYRKFRGS